MLLFIIHDNKLVSSVALFHDIQLRYSFLFSEPVFKLLHQQEYFLLNSYLLEALRTL